MIVSVNTNNEEALVSQFTDFDYLDITMFNGNLVMCSADGVFEYSGDTDSGVGIESWFELATTDFNILNQKRIRAVLGSGLFEGNMLLSVSMDDGTFVDYAISEDQRLNQSVWKRFVHREQKGCHVTVKISNANGGDFSIDTLDAILMLLHNKPSGLGYVGS